MSGILVVDDHRVIAKACGVVLEPIGVEKIISAHDADTGYQAFVEHEPDVSIIDLSLSAPLAVSEKRCRRTIRPTEDALAELRLPPETRSIHARSDEERRFALAMIVDVARRRALRITTRRT